MRLFRRRDWHVMSVSPQGQHYVYRSCWSQTWADVYAREAASTNDGWAYYVRHTDDAVTEVA